MSEPSGDSGASTPTGSSGSGPREDGTPGSDASFEVCPAEPPDVGSKCDLAPNSGCAYFNFGPCEAFVCDGQRTWRSTTGGC